MIKHLIKIMWNKRRSNTLIFLQILLAFVVLFGVYTFGIFNFDRYLSPLGFTYEDGLLVEVRLDDALDSVQVIDLQKRLATELTDLPEVEAAAWIGGVAPFSGNAWQNGNDDNGFDILFKYFFGDEALQDVAGLEINEGRWFNTDDQNAKYPAVLVNRAFKEQYWPTAPTLVDSLIHTTQLTRVVGVVENFKYFSNFAEPEPMVFFSQREVNLPDQAFSTLWLRLRPGSKGGAQESIYNTTVATTKNTDVVIIDVAADRQRANRPVLLPLTIMGLISAFLLINIALGLFGVLFTQISRRRAEIGLRKAVGATPGEVAAQFVGEILIVTCGALFIGAFFAAQIPFLELLPIEGKYFYFGIAAAVLTILLIVILCALIPSRQAAGLHPAIVLHEE